MASKPATAASIQWLESIRKWYYSAAGFNKLGLMQDATIHMDDDVKEVIRRLPKNLYNNRVFHIKRALDLTMRQQIEPKEQWTKYKEDNSTLNHIWKVIWKRKEQNGQRNNHVMEMCGCSCLQCVHMMLVKPEMYNWESSRLKMYYLK